MTLAKRQTAGLFGVLAATVYTVALGMARSAKAAAHPGAMGLAVLCDFAITVPVLYWLLVVRRGYSSWRAVAGLAMAGARVAALLLPSAEQTYFPGARWLAVPLELWLAATVFRNATVKEVLAGELKVFYYALLGWRAKPESRPGYKAFGYAEASGFSTLAILLAVALICEGVPMHLLLHRWSPAAAWIATGLDVYGLLWVAALMQSLRLRPVLAGPDAVVLQAGFVWRVEVARENIRECQRVEAPPEKKAAGYLALTVLNPPQWFMELAEPVTAHGLFGRKRQVTQIGFALDETCPKL